MMRSLRPAAMALAAVAVVVIVSRLPGAAGQGSRSTSVFRLGAVLSSVNETRTMQDARKGYEMFAATMNASAGGRGLRVGGRDGELYFKFRLTSLDDHNDAASHSALVERLLTEDDVHFMLGSHPKFAIQESDMANATGKILYHCCVGPDEVYKAGFRNVFGVTVTNRRYTELMVSSINLNAIDRVAIVRQADNIFTNTTCGAAVDFLSRFHQTVDVRNEEDGGNRTRVPLLTPVINYTQSEVEGQPDWFRQYVEDLRASRAEAVIACALLPEGRRLFDALHEARYPLKSFFITSGPTREDWVADLDPTAADSLLSAAQWSTEVQYEDSFFGKTREYSANFTEMFGSAPSALAAGASAVGYTLSEAIKSAFRTCDIMASEGDADRLLFNASMKCEDQRNITGYERVRLSLKALNMDTFFGKVRFDEYQRNIGMDPVTTQIQVNGTGYKHIVAVLPVEAASASLVMPAENAYRNTCIAGQFLSQQPEHFFDPCQRCERGQVTYQEDEPSCRSCPPYHYWENETSCVVCPETTELSEAVTGGIGIESCVCKEHYYHREVNNSGEECLKCPDGAVCGEGIEGGVRGGICPEAGFWIEVDTKQVYECEDPGNCLGGCNLTGQCRTGHSGRLCSDCEEGYYNFVGQCYSCLPSPVFISMVVALLVAWYILNVVVSSNVASLDMLLSWAQLANIIGEVDLNWPETLSFMFNVANILDFDVDILSPSCLLTWSYKQNFIVQLLLPLIMTLLACVGFLLSWMMYSFSLRCSEARRKLMYSSYWLHWLVNVPENREQLLAKLDFTIAAFFSSLEVTYVTISKYCFDAFKCEHIGMQSVLSTSPDIECGSSEHRDIIKLGVFGIVVYTAGYLAFVAWKLWVLNREHSFPDPVNLRRYGWLYRRFELDYFWTSLIVVARKLLFVVVLVFLNNPAFQAGALAIIINASLMLHVYTAPYVDSFLDILFSFLLVALMFEAFGGVMFFSDNLPQDNRNILEGIVLGSLFLLFAVFVIMFLWEIRRLYHLQKVKQLHEQVILKQESSKKEQRSEISHELLETFDPSFLYKALVKTPENIEGWDELTDMLKAFMSDQSETSYLSMGNKAKFWRNLVERFPELVDFLAVTDSQTRTHFQNFATALYNDFYLKKKVEDLPLFDVLNWRDRAALAQWLAMAKDDERMFFTGVMGKLFRTARGAEVAKQFETKVKSMGRSLSRGADSVKAPSILREFKRRRSKKHDDIIREINAGQGPLAHSATATKFKVAVNRCKNAVKVMDVASGSRRSMFSSRQGSESASALEEDSGASKVEELERAPSPSGSGRDMDSSCNSPTSSQPSRRFEDVDSYDATPPSPRSGRSIGGSTYKSAHEGIPGHRPVPSRTLEDFEVFDSAKERAAIGRQVRLGTIMDYMLGWGVHSRRGVEASTPREREGHRRSHLPKTTADVERGEAKGPTNER